MSFRREKHLKYVRIIRHMTEIMLVLEKLEDLKGIKGKTISKRKKRQWCVHPINWDRHSNGFFNVTFLKAKEADTEEFFTYTRMTIKYYNVLFNIVQPHMIKNSIRQAVDPECRLAILLMHLTQGKSLQSLASSFKLGKETVRSIILETSEVVWNALSTFCVREPIEEDYRKIESDFWNMWNVPNCIGAIDGKHISVKCPPNGGNEFSWHKKMFSLVLMATCDARYSFTFVDVGVYGSQFDGGVLQASKLGQRLVNRTLPLPSKKNLPNSDVVLPHYFVADASFPLGPIIMRPYAGTSLSQDKEDFNKRLSRAHRTIENAFGILVSRWPILLTTIHMMPGNAEKIVLACVALHNFIMLNDENVAMYAPTGYTDWEDSNGELHEGQWRGEIEKSLPSIAPSPSTHQYGGRFSTDMRNALCDYFQSNPIDL